MTGTSAIATAVATTMSTTLSTIIGACLRNAISLLCQGILLCLACMPASMMITSSAHAQAPNPRNAIVAIEVHELAHRIDIRVKLKYAIAAAPLHFSTSNPPRIAVDLPDIDLPAADNATASKRVRLSTRGVLGYNVAQADERSRIVFQLTHAAPYRITTEGDIVVVSID